MCACVCVCAQASALGPARKRDTKPAMASREPEIEPSVQEWLSSEIDYLIANAHIDVSSEGLLSCMRCGTFCAEIKMLFGKRKEIDDQ